MYIERIAERRLKEILSVKGKVGIILGARQVGKTTLVRHFAGNRKCVELNFDVEPDKARFLSVASLSPSHAFKSLGEPDLLILDEAQRLPDSSRTIKGWIDKDFPAKILMLGSSSLNLLNQSAESLTGRNMKLSLPPLTFDEIAGSCDGFGQSLPLEILLENYKAPLRSILLDAMVYGGYPEVVLSSEKVSLLRELSSDYLWKDVLQSGLLKTPELLRRLLALLAHQAGSEVSINELATQLQMARPTIERYLDLLEQTFVIFRLPAYSTNSRKEISKSKKIFFWDTGISNAILGDFTLSASRPDIGRLWENWVIAEAAKWNLLTGNAAEMFFWRSRSQAEIDLIIRRNGKMRAFEIKWGTGKVRGHAFKDAYGIEPEILNPGNPFIGKIINRNVGMECDNG
ncbi:MAG TPA: ATPase [Lentisphaeria bacterium]|nr:MAG: hypothetical protein A2X48_22395 [Lentisphaerae bacterium GWF2_49_21]HBC89184.1 ATPase [Lentisphaeria bacterium]